MLDLVVRQVSEHTDLNIEYQLLKRGRDHDAARCFIARQQLPIPFEQPANDAGAYSARQHLEALRINQPALLATILGDARH